jgi:hypothetical protein
VGGFPNACGYGLYPLGDLSGILWAVDEAKPMEQTLERYVVDAEGNLVAVIVDIEFYRQLLDAWEELEAIQAYDLAKASGEQPIPLEEALRRVEEGRA